MNVNEHKHLDAFFKKLESPKVWEKIHTQICDLRESMHDGGWLDGKSFADAEYLQRIEFDLYRTFDHGRTSKLFEDHLISAFAYPPVTAAELSDLARDHFSGALLLDELGAAFCRFSAHVARLTHQATDDINIGHDAAPVCGISAVPFPEELKNCERLYESPDGFWIAFSPNDSSFLMPKVDVWGKFSDGAMKNLSKAVARIAPSASRTLHLVCCDPKTPSGYGFVPFEVEHEAVWEDFKKLTSSFFTAIVESYFIAPTSKASSLEQRLRNAAHLLVEADNQDSVAVSLSLSFSAIEAMVCQKSQGIVDELSRNVASLLEPDKLNRMEAISAVKKLYNLRSKTLHGASVEGDERAKWKARVLAAAVMKAVVEWREHVARMGDQASRDDFLSELNSLSVTGNQMVGVSEALSKFIPSKENWA
jgi:hypothetical protein